MFDNLKSSEDIVEAEDRLGMSFSVESGVYDFNVDMAYVDYSEGGAMALHLTLTSADATIRQTLWMTSGTAKGCLNHYIDRNNKKQYLPGFVLANDLSLMTCDIEMADQVPEEKTINVYNVEAKKELPTQKQVLTSMIGKPIKAGVFKQTVDKTVKNENFNPAVAVSDANPKYVPTGETREENEIDKFFSSAKSLTVVEAKAGVQEGVFITQWAEKNTGIVRNRAKGAKTEGAATATAPAAAEPKKSLFA